MSNIVQTSRLLSIAGVLSAIVPSGGFRLEGRQGPLPGLRVVGCRIIEPWCTLSAAPPVRLCGSGTLVPPGSGTMMASTPRRPPRPHSLRRPPPPPPPCLLRLVPRRSLHLLRRTRRLLAFSSRARSPALLERASEKRSGLDDDMEGSVR